MDRYFLPDAREPDDTSVWLAEVSLPLSRHIPVPGHGKAVGRGGEATCQHPLAPVSQSPCAGLQPWA